MDIIHPFRKPGDPEPEPTSEAEGLDETCGIMEGLDEEDYTPDDALPAEVDTLEAVALTFRAIEAVKPRGIMAATATEPRRALWLPAVAKEAGLRVAIEPGWETNGRDFRGPLEGVTEHHTASRAGSGNAPSVRIVRDGRSDLAGPLSQIVLGRDGLVIVVAAGMANHAGAGVWDGITDGNGRFIGIEAENSGTGEPWPAVQYDAYVRLVAAILRKIGRPAGRAHGHKEYARPLGRKPDPTFDMVAFRAAVDKVLRGTATTPPVTAPPPAPPGAGVAVAPNGGYYVLQADGGVFTYEVPFFGSAGGVPLAAPMVAIVLHLTDDRKAVDGYWLIGADGGTFNYGAAPYIEGLTKYRLVAPVVAAAASPSQKGLVLVTRDRGVFALGDARYLGRP